MPGRHSVERELSQGAFALIDGLERLPTVSDVTDALARELVHFGIDTFIFTALPNKQQSFEDLVMASRWPSEFFMLYVANDYLRFDPLIRRCLTSHMPFEWHADSYRASADRHVAELMERAAEFGLNHGYVVPIHGPNGHEACASLAGAEPTLTASTKAIIHLLVLYAFDRMRSLRGTLPHKKPALTAREREVLEWAANGKSASQISQALRISKRTVDEHTQTATRKLGAANRTQAVAIALRDRIIGL
jgi:LuxR family quorum sensing-dependent transcriptional regulator